MCVNEIPMMNSIIAFFVENRAQVLSTPLILIRLNEMCEIFNYVFTIRYKVLMMTIGKFENRCGFRQLSDTILWDINPMPKQFFFSPIDKCH